MEEEEEEAAGCCSVGWASACVVALTRCTYAFGLVLANPNFAPCNDKYNDDDDDDDDDDGDGDDGDIGLNFIVVRCLSL